MRGRHEGTVLACEFLLRQLREQGPQADRDQLVVSVEIMRDLTKSPAELEASSIRGIGFPTKPQDVAAPV